MTVHARDWEAFTTPVQNGDSEDAVHMDLAVEGITCAACMGDIERGLSRIPGIVRARVNLTSHRLAVDWQADIAHPEQIISELERMGYKAHPFDPAAEKDRQDQTGKTLLRSLAVAGFAGMNIMLLSVSVWSGNVTDITPETRDLFHWISALIGLPTVVYSGRTFFVSAFRAVWAGRLNMDVPISIGVILAVAMSLFQTIQHHHQVYFESSVMLLFFLLVGRYLDHMMRGRTRSFAENLAALKAEVAARIAEDGSVREVPLSKVSTGDLVLVTAGERIPLDGRVETGVSEIDQSLVTGETDLVQITPGSDVYAGTLNGAGTLKVKVRAASGATLLDEVNRLLETAAQAKSLYVRIADRAARLYAPLVHGASALTFFGWLAVGTGWQPSLIIAISVLIITCPCALGLAVPAVQVVASGLLFRAGVLLNSGDAIERLAAADMVVFDKTGTLTTGQSHIESTAGIPQTALEQARRLALSSRHPLARALVQDQMGLEPYPDVQEVPGAGVETCLDGQVIRLGSPAFCGVDEKEVTRLLDACPGASVLAVKTASGQGYLFPLQQTLRPDAVLVINQLKALGMGVEILSGDREQAVRSAAEALNVATWQAGMKPADKLARLEELKQQGCKVLMIGDGLNDAPSLAGAYVSFSPVTAVHVSQTAADAVFLGDKLSPVIEAILLSRKALRAIEQNLWFSAAYNVVAVPIAVAGYVTPLLAAVAMSASSIAVTANALRLRLTIASAGEGKG